MAGKSLKELIAEPGILCMPGVYDGFSARLVEASGYQACEISGAGLSESRLGQPDVGLMGLETNLAASGSIASCVGIPCLADADTGYGSAVNVHYAVQAFERAGVAGVMLEDQTWPKRCGHLNGKEVIDADEMVGKIRAAVEARISPDFVIKARTDAAGALGVDEAIRRANLYAEAGADLLFADALLSRADIAKFAKQVHGPVSVNMGLGIRSRPTTPLMSAKQLEDVGVAVVVFARILTAAAVRGMRNALTALGRSIESGDVVEEPDTLVSFEELQELVGLDNIHAMESRYLTAEELARKYGSR